MGSLFHEAMKLRESLYQREVYAPRLASLKAASDEDTDELFAEFERILGKAASRLNEVVAEIRILLAQTRDQLRRLLVERAAERVVTRFLLRRREAVSETFPEGFDGLLEAMHSDVATGLVESGRDRFSRAPTSLPVAIPFERRLDADRRIIPRSRVSCSTLRGCRPSSMATTSRV